MPSDALPVASDFTAKCTYPPFRSTARIAAVPPGNLVAELCFNGLAESCETQAGILDRLDALEVT